MEGDSNNRDDSIPAVGSEAVGNEAAGMEADPASDWDAFGGYMNAKKQKLSVQYEQDRRSSNAAGSKIFAGVAILVNGYTEPSAPELKRLMLENGGSFHVYESSSTTHIVASNLPKSKIVKLKPTDKVVSAKWITDSIDAGYQLPDRDYLLYADRQGFGSLRKFTVPEKAQSRDDPYVSEDNNDNNHNTIASTSSANFIDAPTSTTTPSSSKSGAAVPKTTDPRFLQDYYANSRLHFISTWGQEMKRLVEKLKSQSSADVALAGREKLLRQFGRRKERGLGKIGSGGASIVGSVIAHIDMDSFFVSVALVSRPELRGRPLAVTHSKGTGPNKALSDSTGASADSGNFCSYAEIASCSYEARAAGVTNGMLMGKARQLCPKLVAVPYDFDQYHQISQRLYTIVASYTLKIKAVSCDELYVDLTDLCDELAVDGPPEIVQHMRSDIFENTRCTASCGLGPNMLAARLATRKAKPNGQYWIDKASVEDFIRDQPIKDLPGVGYSMLEKLEGEFGGELRTCEDLQRISVVRLQKVFGPKHGQQLCNLCRGVDDRKVEEGVQMRKSVSCDINFGIRFQELFNKYPMLQAPSNLQESEAIEFLGNLSNEVSKKLREAGMVGRTITLKLLTRQADAPVNPKKYMGCGRCDAASRSVTIVRATDDERVLAKEAVQLLAQIRPPIVDLRGVGMMVTKLEPVVTAGRRNRQLPRPNSGSLDRFVRKHQPTPAVTTNRLLASRPSSSFELRKNNNPVVAEVEETIRRSGMLDAPMPKLDPDFLAALPEKLRLEILANPTEYCLPARPSTSPTEERTRSHFTSNARAMHHNVQQPILVDRDGVADESEQNERLQPKLPMYRGASDYEDVKMAVKQAVANSSEVWSKEAGAEFCDFLRDQFSLGKLKTVACIVRVFERACYRAVEAKAGSQPSEWDNLRAEVHKSLRLAGIRKFGSPFVVR